MKSTEHFNTLAQSSNFERAAEVASFGRELSAFERRVLRYRRYKWMIMDPLAGKKFRRTIETYFEEEKLAFEELILKAIRTGDFKQLADLTAAVEFLENAYSTRKDVLRVLLLQLKMDYENNPQRIFPLPQLAEILRGCGIKGSIVDPKSPDGFSQLRALCEKMKMPYLHSRQKPAKSKS